jgi:hypothetical protein
MTVAAVVLCICNTPQAFAAPMKCSGEQKNCVTVCQKTLSPGLVPACANNCRTRLNNCQHTGCWDSGVRRYCGLLRR